MKMANPLFNMLGNAMPQGAGQVGNLIQQFQQFRNSFRGDPRQQVQQLLNSGRISQEQYNWAVQMANQMRGMIK